jgi:hypothetical protein
MSNFIGFSLLILTLYDNPGAPLRDRDQPLDRDFKPSSIRSDYTFVAIGCNEFERLSANPATYNRSVDKE